MRAYQNDKVQVRVLVGGYLFNHNFSMYGLKWLFEPSASNSGYRDNQAMGISEHFEFVFTLPPRPPYLSIPIVNLIRGLSLPIISTCPVQGSMI